MKVRTWKFARDYHGVVDAKAGEEMRLTDEQVAFINRTLPDLISPAQFQDDWVVDEAVPPKMYRGGQDKMVRAGMGADK